jgi:hypothetical protein
MASLVWGIEDFVVEHGEVEGKTEADWVGWGQVCLSDFGGSLVSLERLVGRGLALVADGKLGKVAVVITLPARELIRVPARRPLWLPYILW